MISFTSAAFCRTRQEKGGYEYGDLLTGGVECTDLLIGGFECGDLLTGV